MKVTKAVLPVAGLGTRFLPASKSIPKEMATVVDRPAIDYVVQEAVAAGIKQIILVTHGAKKAVEDYFDTNYELEDILEKKNKQDILASIRNIIPADVSVVSVRQGKPLGLGHAVLCAKSVIGEEPFAVLLPDVLVDGDAANNDLNQMIQRYEQSLYSQIMVEQVPQHLVNQYGVVDLGGTALTASQSAKMHAIVEKPALDKAPSNLAVVGRYVLPARILTLLESTAPGAGGEIQLTDAIAALMKEEIIEAYQMAGKTHDCGSKLGYLEAVLHYALKHPQLGADFKVLLQNIQTT